MIRVLLADDQALVRDGFRMILEAQEDITVVGEAANGREAVRQARALRPDVVLMDIRMPELDGLEATRQLLAPGHASGLRVLVLTTFDVDSYVYDAMKAGASGFLLKDVPRRQLIEGVRTVATGDALLSPSITRRLIAQFVQAPPPASGVPEQLAGLTERELSVLRLVAQGCTNAEVAGELFLAETTVKTHLGHILTKLGLRDRIHAVVVAYETGLVRPGAGPKRGAM